MTDNMKYAQLQSFSLAGAGSLLGDTTLTLNSMKQIDGTTLVTMADFGTKGYATIEPGSGTQEEAITFTGITQNANGTATLTGVKNQSFVAPYTETSGLATTHPGGVILIITNTAGYYNRFANKDDDESILGLWNFPNGASNPTIGVSYTMPTTDLQIATKKYVDDVAVFGAPLASDVTIGIAKLSVAAASPTDPISVGDNDPRMPTQDEKNALAGTGTPSATNKYVTQDMFPAGVMQMYGGSSAPTGWLFCDGASVLRATYADLFTAIGTTYGSADGTHFNVPDLRGRSPIGVGTGTGGGAAGTGLPTGGSALTAVARAGWKGEETHLLTSGESGVPAHSHSPQIFTVGGPVSTNLGGAGAASSASTAGPATATNTPADAAGAHNNIQPVMGVNFLIKT